jgi:hypothetical protein
VRRVTEQVVSAKVKQIYLIDLAGASEVGGISGEANLAPKTVAKILFLDVVPVLKAHGITATGSRRNSRGSPLVRTSS